MDLGVFLSKIASDGRKSSEWTTSDGTMIPYPYWNIRRRKASFAIARTFIVGRGPPES